MEYRPQQHTEPERCNKEAQGRPSLLRCVCVAYNPPDPAAACCSTNAAWGKFRGGRATEIGPKEGGGSASRSSSPPVKLAATPPRRRSTSARAVERSATTTSRRAPGCCDEGALGCRDHVPQRLRFFATPLSSALQDCISASLHVGKKAAVLHAAHSVRKHSHSCPAQTQSQRANNTITSDRPR